MNKEIIYLIISLYILIPIFIELMVYVTAEEYCCELGFIKSENGKYVRFPNHLYEITEMNYFSCIVVSIILFLLTPATSVFKLFHWITHIGRK